MTNPLLQSSNIPVEYPAITLENMGIAFDHVLQAHRQGIARIIEQQQVLPTWDDLVLAVDALDAQLLAVLYGVMPLLARDEDWAQAIMEFRSRTIARFDQKFINGELHTLYARLAATPNGVNLDESKRATLGWHLAKFASSGAVLAADDKARLADLQAQTGTLQQAFLGNIARPGLRVGDEAELRGLPPRLLRELVDGESGWLIACERTVVEAVLRHAQHRPLRERLYRAFHTRGVHTDPEQDNGHLLQRLAEARDEKARLLGFASHPELSLRAKSAGSLRQVGEFLQTLADAVRPAVAQWRERLKQQAIGHGLEGVEPWDVDFLQQQSAGEYSSEALREHFPLSGVVDALIQLAWQLFALELRPGPLPVWDPSVQTFEVWQDHARIGFFYLDAQQHAGKQPDAVYTNYVRNRRVDAEGIYQAAVVVVNSDIPAGAEPLLDHLSLRKLYHEFGHALHHLLVRTGNHVMSNLTELGTDGVELFGKLFERWVWDAGYLAGIAVPRADGEVLGPVEAEVILGRLKQESIGEISLDLSLALFDLDLHATPGDGSSLAQRLARARERCGYWPLADFERPAHAFDYLANGYDAGYYAYLWADVNAFDLFTRFQAQGLLDPTIGKALREALFAPGASRALRKGVEEFLGRAPNAQAYLRWHGLD